MRLNWSFETFEKHIIVNVSFSNCLSQGEKMRVDIAKALCLDQPLVVFDEFTSVVDREIAKVSSFAISKAVRRSSKKISNQIYPIPI